MNKINGIDLRMKIIRRSKQADSEKLEENKLANAEEDRKKLEKKKFYLN